MKSRKLLAMMVMLALTCASCAKGNTVTQTDHQTESHRLANANATAEARRLYDVLWSLQGKKTVSGVVASVDWNVKEADIVNSWTGRYPAINIFDFININASKDVNPNGWVDYSDDTVVRRWAKAGGIVSCMWHWQMLANNGTDYTCTPGTEATQTSFDPTCIDNPKSDGYKLMLSNIDQVAGYLKKMQKHGIAVLWRPLHEGSGNTYEYEGGTAWFWWGIKGADTYKKLWRFLYDRLVNYHKLNNLIWVWNSQMGDDDWYPGDDVVDVVGRDSYYALQYPLMKEYKALAAKYPSKLIALAECGNGDDVKMSSWSDIWKDGSRWSWFTTWYDYDYDNGKSYIHRFADKQWWQDAFNSGPVLDRDQMKEILNDGNSFQLNIDEDDAQQAPEEYTFAQGELFHGELTFPNDWSGNLRITAAPFQKCTTNDVLVISYKLLPKEEGVEPQMSFRENRGSWRDIETGAEPEWQPLNGNDVVVTFSDTSLDKAKMRGLVVTGRGFVLEKIELMKVE